MGQMDIFTKSLTGVIRASTPWKITSTEESSTEAQEVFAHSKGNERFRKSLG